MERRGSSRSLASRPNVSDELFLKPERMKIFVSSKMRDGTLRRERKAAAEAIEATPISLAWYWERDAKAGPYSSERVCVGHARTSDGLVLILSDDITPITRREFRAAKTAGAPCFILVKEGAALSASVRRFLARERRGAISQTFSNLSELRTAVTGAINFHAVMSARVLILKRRRTPRNQQGRRR
jgi:hypothetical protein